jgi:hypothetical protein
MSRRSRTVRASARLALRLLLVCVLGALGATVSRAATATAAATPEPVPPRPNWDAGWHVVRPGDTLEGLARRFLGSYRWWRELHRLNPAIRDPDLLIPGQRIRIWIERPTPQPNAQVETVAGKVEERPQPVPWRPAAEGDLLLERDIVRTFDRGSSRLRFDDGSAVTLTENSLVFIRRLARDRAAVQPKEIEVRVGRADVEAAPAPGRAPEIDIVLGEARGRAAASAGAELQARTSREERGDSRLMIYRGHGEVAAAGRKVELPEGTGTSVAPRQPPRPAEALLPAPALGVPAPDGELGLDDPLLTWAPVPGAATYTVEVCSDADCGHLIERAAGITEESYRLAGHPDAAAWWRVTAASASGLDGFPAASRRFRPVDSVGPPAPTLVLRGAGGAPLAPDACVPERPGIEVTARDRYGRELAWTLEVDGSERAVDSAFPASATYSAAAVAHDSRGRTAASAPVRFRLDLTDPWTDLPPVPKRPERSSIFAVPSRRPRAVCALGLELRTPDGAWTPVPCAESGADPAPLSIPLAGDAAEIRLRVSHRARLGEHLPLLVDTETPLHVGDIGCGLVGADVRILSSRDSGAELEVVTHDGSGRTGRDAWSLEAR